MQLSVLVLAALGGITFLGESATLRLVLASVARLGGIAIVMREKKVAAGGDAIASAASAARGLDRRASSAVHSDRSA